MANDIMWEKQELIPYKNKYHVTNAGWLNPFLDGEYLGDAQQTLEYYFRRYSIPNQENNFFNRISAQTVLSTKMWMVFVKWKWINPDYDSQISEKIKRAEARKSPEPVSYDYLNEIRNIAEANGSKFLLFVIKIHTELHKDIAKEMPMLFRDLPFSECKNLLRSDYNEWPDGHFNNNGHGKFAHCVLEKLN